MLIEQMDDDVDIISSGPDLTLHKRKRKRARSLARRALGGLLALTSSSLRASGARSSLRYPRSMLPSLPVTGPWQVITNASLPTAERP